MMTRRAFVTRLALVLGVVGCHDRCTPTQPPAPQPADGWHGAPARSAYRGRVPGLYSRTAISREMIEQQMRVNALHSQILEIQNHRRPIPLP